MTTILVIYRWPATDSELRNTQVTKHTKLQVTKHASYEAHELRNTQGTKHKNVNCEQPLLGVGLAAAETFLR